MMSISDDSMRSLGSSSKSTTKRKVHFRISQFSYVEPEHLEAPPLAVSDLFYTKQELENIHLENNAIITCLEADSYCLFSDDVSSPTRGLEDRTRQGARRRFWHQQQASRIVMREQARQRREGIWEPETIAQLYSLFSQGSRSDARKIGKKDAIVAKKAIEEMEWHHRRQMTPSNSFLMTPPLSPLSPTFVGSCVRQLYGMEDPTTSNKKASISIPQIPLWQL